MNAIKIFGENFVNEDCDIACSSGNTLAQYLYDQNRDSKWTSSGSNDTVTETITVIFKNWQGVEVNRTFNRIVLQNTNFKAVTAEYWDGAAWQSIAEAALTLAAADKIIETAASKTGSRIRVNVATAQTENAEKYLGELKVCLAIFTGDQQWSSSFQRQDEQGAGYNRTADGKLRAWKEWTRFAGNLTLTEVSQADHDTLFPYLGASSLLTVVFCDDFDPAAVHECMVVSPPNHILDRKSQRYEISMELQGL